MSSAGSRRAIGQIDVAEIREIVFRELRPLVRELDVGLVFDDRGRDAEHDIVRAVRRLRQADDVMRAGAEMIDRLAGDLVRSIH